MGNLVALPRKVAPPCVFGSGRENVEEKGLENNAKIDMPNPVSLYAHSPCDTLQKDVSNTNNTATEQTKIDTRVVLCQTPNESPESAANNFSTGLVGLSMEEGQETTSRTATNVPGVASAPVLPDLKIEVKIATLVVSISAGGIVGLLAGLPGNEKAALTHIIFFKAYTSLTYASFILGLGLLVLIKIRPKIDYLVEIAKFTMWVSLGSETYAISFGTCILLHTSLIALIPVLIVPLVLAGLVVILKYVRK